MPYQEQLKNAEALVAVEKARLRNAEIELERLHPLVANEVISEVQLRQAESDYAVAKASLEQSQALAATLTNQCGIYTHQSSSKWVYRQDSQTYR